MEPSRRTSSRSQLPMASTCLVGKRTTTGCDVPGTRVDMSRVALQNGSRLPDQRFVDHLSVQPEDPRSILGGLDHGLRPLERARAGRERLANYGDMAGVDACFRVEADVYRLERLPSKSVEIADVDVDGVDGELAGGPSGEQDHGPGLFDDMVIAAVGTAATASPQISHQILAAPHQGLAC